jgi:hypothetical protein
MKTYKVAGYSYFDGYYVSLGTIEAKSERAAKLLARKLFDSAGFGYADFLVREVA